VFEVSFREDDPNRLPVAGPTEGMNTASIATEAVLGFLVHLDLGDQPAGRGLQPREVDAGCLADQAASSVAPDEVVGSHRLAADELDVDPVSSWAKPLTSRPR